MLRCGDGPYDAARRVMLMPTVSRYMTRQPWTIASRSSLSDAHALMHAHRIRHLPVVDDDTLVGIVSDRDLRVIESLGGLQSARVRDAMSEPVYAVAPGDAIDEVVRTMSERKYGSVVVVANDGTVEGIFTAMDARRVLAELLERATA